MAFNGSGVFSRPVADYVFDSIISETDMNTEMDGIATGLTNCITKDGQTDTTAKINFASGIGTDTISEKTTATGVTVDGVLLKDSAVNVDTIAEKTAAAGVTVDGVLLKDGGATLKDSATYITDESDATKKVQFQLSGVTTATTRTLTVPDKDGTIATSADVTSAVASAVPAGVVVPYAGTSAPTGYLFCDGSAVSRTTYSDLFTAISTTYGTGDGSTTFNLPDLRGRVVAGQDDMGGTSANRLTNSTTNAIDGDTLGAVGGHEIHALQTAEIPAHTHPLLTGVAHDGGGGAFEYGTGASSTGKVTGSTGGGSNHNNVQPTIILNYIIKT